MNLAKNFTLIFDFRVFALSNLRTAAEEILVKEVEVNSFDLTFDIAEILFIQALIWSREWIIFDWVTFEQTKARIIRHVRVIRMFLVIIIDKKIEVAGRTVRHFKCVTCSLLTCIH